MFFMMNKKISDKLNFIFSKDVTNSNNRFTFFCMINKKKGVKFMIKCHFTMKKNM